MTGHTGHAHGPRLVLAPSTERGWFGGRSLVASRVTDVRPGATLAEAAEALGEAFDGDGTEIVAVLAPYDGSCTVVRFSGADNDGDVRRAFREDGGRLPLLVDARWDTRPREYRAAVREARARIAAGEVYVVNLAARLTGRLNPELHPLDVGVAARAFGVLRQRASADMDALFDNLPGSTPWIASVSPERFLRVTRDRFGGRTAEICPIKGTAPRGLDAATDRLSAEALAADAKERAEHVMVVDLERNDLGRCCVPGTIAVDPLYEVVPTPYCHQLVSTVRGALRPNATFGELLDSAFPGGSVTGAPKLAARGVIAELEVSQRGAYCGALLVARSGEMDSSVLIRTLEGLASDPEAASWGAGCGVTHESDPAAEYVELLLKAAPATGDAPPPVALRETMRVSRGRVPLLDFHLARLASGGSGHTTLAGVREQVRRLADGDLARREYARIGITITPDGAIAAGITDDPSTLHVDGGPIVVPVCVEAPPKVPRAAAKPASRRWWDKAHVEARMRGGHQALIVTPDGRLVDGSTANVWLRHGDVLSTPCAPPAIAGIGREIIFDHAEANGLHVEERELTLSDFESAEDVWLSNAIAGLVKARRPLE